MFSLFALFLVNTIDSILIRFFFCYPHRTPPLVGWCSVYSLLSFLGEIMYTKDEDDQLRCFFFSRKNAIDSRKNVTFLLQIENDSYQFFALDSIWSIPIFM